MFAFEMGGLKSNNYELILYPRLTLKLITLVLSVVSSHQRKVPRWPGGHLCCRFSWGKYFDYKWLIIDLIAPIIDMNIKGIPSTKSKHLTLSGFNIDHWLWCRLKRCTCSFIGWMTNVDKSHQEMVRLPDVVQLGNGAWLLVPHLWLIAIGNLCSTCPWVWANKAVWDSWKTRL